MLCCRRWEETHLLPFQDPFQDFFPLPLHSAPGSSAGLRGGELRKALHTSSTGPVEGSIFPALYAIGCSMRCAGRRCCYSQVPCLRLWHSLYGGTCLSPLLHRSQSQTHQSSCHSNPAGLKSHHEPPHAKPPWKWHNQVCKTASSTCKNQIPPTLSSSVQLTCSKHGLDRCSICSC